MGGMNEEEIRDTEREWASFSDASGRTKDEG